MKFLPAAIAALSVAAAGSASAATVNIWSTTFDTGNEYESTGPFVFSSLFVNFGGSSIQGAQSLPGFGNQFLRNDTSGTTTLGASGLAAHTALALSFDLAFIDSWDSLNGSPAPDLLNVNINGLAPFAFTSNNASGSVADYGPGVVVGSGAYGFNGSWRDVVVHYEFLIPHTAATWDMAINFGGSGFQGGLDESWGIDNFSLAAVQATPGGVPEPATWAMMIAGFGLSGTMLRRRARALTA